MENKKFTIKDEGIWKGFDFYREEIKKAGVLDKLRFFNDVITEKKPPHPDSNYREPVLTNIVIDEKKCDIYHTDHEEGHSWSRLYIHIKE